MTIKDLKRRIKKLPDNMPIMIETANGVLFPFCDLSGLEEIDVPVDEESEETESVPIFIIRSCTCNNELVEGEINSQPELN